MRKKDEVLKAVDHFNKSIQELQDFIDNYYKICASPMQKRRSALIKIYNKLLESHHKVVSQLPEIERIELTNSLASSLPS